MRAETLLQKNLSQGRFAVTCEFTQPCGTEPDQILKFAAKLKGKVDAVAVTDNTGANVGMASWAVAKILLDLGIEPVLQMATRDRNRIALQSDLLGAAAMGIQNVLCLSGVHQAKGDHPPAKKVFDLDSIQWITTVKQIRDQKCLMNDKKISGPVPFFTGGVANPVAEPLELHSINLRKKIAAGAQFIQTRPIMDMEHFSNWLNHAANQDLTNQCFLMAGVMPLASVKMARELQNNAPGLLLPDSIIKRLGEVPEDKQQEEGISICIEQIEMLRQTKGIKGVHILAAGFEARLEEIMTRAGLLPRPDIS